MKTVSKIAEIKKLVSQWKSKDRSIGLVPTMGFLHACGSSLFVNFGWVNRIGDFKVCFECGDEIEMGHNRYYRLKASYVKSMGLLTGEKLKIYDAGIPM